LALLLDLQANLLVNLQVKLLVNLLVNLLNVHVWQLINLAPLSVRDWLGISLKQKHRLSLGL